ncbi:hypothetical protein B0H14DRAFT_2634012 [Mycena olivaceomarginata]|nr:hypothetical protein B0H14DRAFT_2637022 [Mycena olivaceomarginata]KAJ7761868.1 hypothetical protein B0H14DRAFT_2634012 [Mycena olivaceomarginata]
MPTPSLPYKCGSPGCDRKFEKPEYLHQHTKDFHSPSRPLPKQQTYKCGVEGCEAPSFSQLSLLHEHTAKAHPKPGKNTPSGSSTSAFSTQGHPIPITNTRSTQAPVLMSQHVPPQEPPPSYTANEAICVAICLFPPISGKVIIIFRLVASTSTSLAAQNAVSSPDYAPAAVLIDKSTLKVGMHFVELAEKVILSSTNNQRICFWNRLQERVEWMSKHNNVCSLAYSAKFRADVRMLLRSDVPEAAVAQCGRVTL